MKETIWKAVTIKLMLDSLPFVTTFGEVSRGEKMALRGTDPELYSTEYSLVYEDQRVVKEKHKQISEVVFV